jgi:hypothetical protein
MEGRKAAAFPNGNPQYGIGCRRHLPAENISCGEIQIALVSPATRRTIVVIARPPRDCSRIASLQLGVSFDIVQ